MATITLNDKPVHTSGTLPQVGTTAPAFTLCDADLSDIGLERFAGKVKILNISPSLDTGICAASAHRFNREVAVLSNTVVLHITADLPFAQKRFCEAHSLSHIVALSTFRAPAFGRDYGVQITDGPMAGLPSRAVLVLDADNKVVYTQQVPEIAQEPDYAPVLASASRAASSRV